MFRARGAFVGAVALALLPLGVQAQPPGGIAQPRPAYSPYLNLARRDAPPGFNYYGLVRPQIATQNSLLTLQQQIAVTQQQQQIVGQPVVNPELPLTGQQTFFLNTGGYFLNNRAGGVPITTAVTTRNAPTMPPRPARPR
jgi:hypothetical protein